MICSFWTLICSSCSFILFVKLSIFKFVSSMAVIDASFSAESLEEFALIYANLSRASMTSFWPFSASPSDRASASIIIKYWFDNSSSSFLQSFNFDLKASVFCFWFSISSKTASINFSKFVSFKVNFAFCSVKYLTLSRMTFVSPACFSKLTVKFKMFSCNLSTDLSIASMLAILLA